MEDLLVVLLSPNRKRSTHAAKELAHPDVSIRPNRAAVCTANHQSHLRHCGGGRNRLGVQ